MHVTPARVASVALVFAALVVAVGPRFGVRLANATEVSEPAPTETPAPVMPTSDTEPETTDDEPKAPAKPKSVSIARLAVPERDGMVLVPGGRFPMGTNFPKSPPNERPQRAVLAAPFWIDKTEVTVAAYKTCVDGKRCERPRKSSAACTFDVGEGDLPVNCVRWQDAEAFCRDAKKRLPSEVEWELSARGPMGYVYPWGNRLPDCKLANTLVRDNSGRGCTTRPWRVGSVPSNASLYGVLDLTGNVEEWTADWYSEHLSDIAPRSGASHSLRGGGFQTAPSRSRASTRDWGSSIEAGPNVGFRCARDAVVPAAAAPNVMMSRPKPSPKPAASAPAPL